MMKLKSFLSILFPLVLILGGMSIIGYTRQLNRTNTESINEYTKTSATVIGVEDVDTNNKSYTLSYRSNTGNKVSSLLVTSKKYTLNSELTLYCNPDNIFEYVVPLAKTEVITYYACGIVVLLLGVGLGCAALGLNFDSKDTTTESAFALPTDKLIPSSGE